MKSESSMGRCVIYDGCINVWSYILTKKVSCENTTAFPNSRIPHSGEELLSTVSLISQLDGEFRRRFSYRRNTD